VHTWIVINPKAGGADAAASVRKWAASQSGVTCRQSEDAATCRTIVEEAVSAGAEQVVAAGGDGTISTVVNALQSHDVEVQLALLPMGTGNDLARTLAIPREIDEALQVLEAGRTARIDLFHLEAADVSRYGINASAGGFSGQVDEAMTGEVKAAWGPLAFLVGAAQVLPDLQQYETRVAFDDGPQERVEAFNIVIANGRTAAGGRRVAPTANPCDGRLDVVIVRWGTPSELAEVGTRLMAGNYLESERVMHRQVRSVQVTSTPGMWFNVDGELVTKQPVTIRVLPGRQRVVVGSDFTAQRSQEEMQ
jgi:diacylglycerol kinase (ATP)